MKVALLEESMKKKLLILFTFALLLSVLFSGCRKSNRDPNDVLNFIKSLDSYSTSYKMDIMNDKQTITYEGKQYYDKKLGYRLELGEDRVFIYKDDKIYVQDVKNKNNYILNKDFDDIYKISFIKEYLKLLYTDEDIKYDFKTIDNKSFQLIYLTIPGGSREMSRAVMYVNLKTYFPEMVLIYDEKGNERRRITYTNFVSNPTLDQKLFKIQ
jgi:outer membrane lipoprotein-sorting protein